MKLGAVDYVQDHSPHFGGVAQRGWSGQIRDLLHLGVSFLSLSLSSCTAATMMMMMMM